MNKKTSIKFGILVVLFVSILIFILLFDEISRLGISEVNLKNTQETKVVETVRDDASSPLREDGSIASARGEGDFVNTSDWIFKKNDVVNFSFLYPKNAKIIDEGSCYRVEYGLGFVIFFLPVEVDARCGARTGVGILPDNVDVIDYLIVGGEKYEVLGFNAVMDTKEEDFFNPEKRYFYDFHYMFDLNKDKNCGDAGGCMRVGYGIYKEVPNPLNKNDIDDTMDTLRDIIESVNFVMPQKD